MESPNIAGRRNKAWTIHRVDSTQELVLLGASELPMISFLEHRPT